MDLDESKVHLKSVSYAQDLIDFFLALAQNLRVFSGLTTQSLYVHLNLKPQSPESRWLDTPVTFDRTGPAPSHSAHHSNAVNEGEGERALLQAGELIGINPKLFDVCRLSYALLIVLHHLPRLQLMTLEDAGMPLPTLTLATFNKLSIIIPPSLLSLAPLDIHGDTETKPLTRGVLRALWESPVPQLSALPLLKFANVNKEIIIESPNDDALALKPCSQGSMSGKHINLSSLGFHDAILDTHHVVQLLALGGIYIRALYGL